MSERHTYIVTSRLARSQAFIEAARARAHGRQVLSPAQAAARLAGGFLQVIEREALQEALQEILQDQSVDLGALNNIRDLPGMVRAAAGTLQRVWLAGMDMPLPGNAEVDERQAEIANLEAAVCERMPSSMRRPRELVDIAMDRIELASTILGPVTLVGVPDLDPVWRRFFSELSKAVSVRWELGQFDPPPWLEGTGIESSSSAASFPETLRVACANPRHEALEAMRWARELIASGIARPEEIAIAAPATQEWDEHLATISADANLPLAFAAGRPALSTRDGQAAAALAEVLRNGLSQNRVRRLLSQTRGMTAVTAKIPSDWHRIIPRDAPLLQADRWHQMIEQCENWPEGGNFGAFLGALINRLDQGLETAEETGEALLSGRAQAMEQGAAGGPGECPQCHADIYQG